MVEGPRWVGRVDASDPNAVRFGWQGAGFVSGVEGSSIAVRLRTEGTDTVYFQPVIDGEPGARFPVDSGADREVLLASGLGAGQHLVELYRETEGMYGVSTFLGFSQGQPTLTPAATDRFIEVVGDSISAGYGNLGSEPHPNWVADPACHWTAENSSWYASYAAVAGRALGAEVSTIARSGAGMYRDLGGSTTNVLSAVYGLALGSTVAEPWDFAREPSAVLINLGTNDWASGDPGVAFETSYVDFIAQLRSHYPNAWIFLLTGSMLGGTALSQAQARLESVIATVTATTGDTRLATVALGTQDLGADGSIPSGCDWHPSAAEHLRMAGVLQQELAAHLGW